MTASGVKTRIVYSDSLDPWWNLAVEEYLLDTVEENEAILYLWQNQNTVVIGKNQNAWKECRTKELEAEGGKLARRLSGGGAVFHDTGNLNFTFVVDRKLYDLEKQLQVILDAVRSQGIQAEFSGRNDILAEGRKFSGNAFCFRTQAAYHHGTILVNADFSKLTRYLQVSTEKMAAKGVQSVQSRVVNLTEFNADITIDIMKESLKAAFCGLYGGDCTEMRIETNAVVDTLYQKYASWEWRYGETPYFDVTYETRFTWGGVEAGFSLKNGTVQGCTVYSDAMDSELMLEIAQALRGIPFTADGILEGLENVKTDSLGKVIVDEMGQWLGSKV